MEIYVHVPFCVRKCDYCDFVSFSGAGDMIRPYFARLKEEIKEKSAFFGRGLPVDSVFFGGGTPSFPDAHFIIETLECLREHFTILPEAEITIECNPASATLDKLKAYKASGINRISIGLQSADETELRSLSRVHSFPDFLDTFNGAKEAGFTNISVDIMSGIPGQTKASLSKTLNTVCGLNPQHISVYSLILEEGTPFYDRYAGRENSSLLPSEYADREMYHETARILKEKGYERYEISNYAIPGYECRHNEGYWTRKPYLGFGIAAASLYDNVRYQKHGDLRRYIDGDFSEEKEAVDTNGQMEEFMFLGLRMTKGVSRADFLQCFNMTIDQIYQKPLERLASEGMIIDDGDRIRLTDKGLDLENYCTGMFVL